MSPRYDVFLSHATADKPEVEKLAHKLRREGIEPFLDKWHLIPGEPWEEALEEALDESRTCAVFLGPTGIGGWQNEEMRSALETRVSHKTFRVIPVLLPGSFEPRKEELPRFLRRLTWVDFRAGLDDEEAFRRLVSGIRGTAPGPGGGGGGPVKPPRPYPYRSMAQAPEEFVPRREYEVVLEAICSKDSAVQSVGITTALRGAGGFGKTALAQQLCQDERVWDRYTDGILWTTMGEEIDANGRLSRIRDLIRWWTREEAPSFETVAAASARLRELLASSRVLIVIDDVWSSADVTPFQGTGNGSALLITTRDSQTLPSDSKRIEVDAMVSDEAVALLRSGLLDGGEREFISLAARLGEWPLLLKMVNRYLRDLINQDGFTTTEALEKTRKALDKKGFSAFNLRNKEERHAAAGRTISVSIQRLTAEEAERYLQLAVFPEDADVPISVLRRLWSIDADEAEGFCGRLYDLSLLLRFNRRNGTIRLHDVTREVLIEQIGNRLPDLHRHLLDIFRPANGSWSDLPMEEEYLWQNLAGHLLGASRKDELRRLLTDLSFLQAKLNATDVNALMADYKAFGEGERELRLIRDALRLSAHVLARDGQQLASQLFGRLSGNQGDGIEQLLDSAKARLLLRPRQGSLAPAGGPLIRTLEGDGVSAVAVVDGYRAVSGSHGGMLRVWDLESGEFLFILEGHLDGVCAVAVVDKYRAVSSSYDGTLRIWNLETGETLRILQGHSGGVFAVAVVDGCRVVSGSGDKTLRVWDLETGETIRILKGHLNKVTAVSVVDGRRVISSSYDGRLRVWDLETGETLRTLKGHSGWISTVGVLGGHRVVSGSSDGTLWVWNLGSGKIMRTLQAHSSSINSVAVLDGQRIVSGSDDGRLRLWDLETDETFLTLKGHSDKVNAVAVVDGCRVVSASSDRTLRVWDLETGETLHILEGHSGKVNAVAVVDDYRAISTSSDQTLRVWDLETGETLRILEGHLGEVQSIKMVDSCQAISLSFDGTLRAWNLETGETRTFKGHSVWVVDGHRAISYSYPGKLRVWDPETGETLRVWDLETGETLHTLEGSLTWITVVAVDDCRAVIYANEELLVWDLETGETLQTLEGWISAMVMAGRRAISGSYDQTLRVWDLKTGETMGLVTLEAPISAVAVSPDGRIVVAGDQTGRVHFLDLVEPE